MIELDKITLKRGDFILKQISFHIKKGEIYLLLGDSGSGKTTILELVSGFIKPEAGKIIMNDNDIIDLPPDKRNIAYLPQKMSLFPHLTIKENILYGVKVRGISLDRNYYNMLISRLEIGDILESYPDHISGGQAQRAALTRAMIVKPNLLLLDEPFSALHPSLRYELVDLIKSMADEFHLTILAVSHDIEEALYLSDIVSFIYDGAIIQTAKKNEIYFRPKTVKVARFFGIDNLFTGKIIDMRDDNLIIETIFGNINVERTYREKDIKIKERLIWGIHSDEVRIVRRNNAKMMSNRLTGVIKQIFPHGQYWNIHFICANDVIKIRIPDFVYGKLNISRDSKAEVNLPGERIFIIRQKNAS